MCLSSAGALNVHEAKNLLLVQDKNMHVKCNEMVPSPLSTMQVYLIKKTFL